MFMKENADDNAKRANFSVVMAKYDLTFDVSIITRERTPEISNPLMSCNLIIFVFENPLSHGNWKQLKSHEYNFYEVVLEWCTIFVEKWAFFPRKKTDIRIGRNSETNWILCQMSRLYQALSRLPNGFKKQHDCFKTLHFYSFWSLKILKFDHQNCENVTFYSKIFTVTLYWFIKAVPCNIYYCIQICFYSHNLNQINKPQPIVLEHKASSEQQIDKIHFKTP